MKDLSVGEVANKIGEPYHRIIRKIKRNEFPGAYKVGWGWIIPEASLKKHLAGGWQLPVKEKVTVQLISKQFDLIPAYSLRKALNK